MRIAKLTHKVSSFFGSQITQNIKHPKIEVGDYILLTRTYSPKQVETFADISGDNNPIHLNEEAAKNSIFKKRVVHGMLTGSIFTQMIGSTLQDSIYLSQTFSFTAPVFLNEEVEGKMEVIEVNHEKKKIKFKTTLRKVEIDKIAIQGEALILYKHLEKQP